MCQSSALIKPIPSFASAPGSFHALHQIVLLLRVSEEGLDGMHLMH